MSTPTRTHWFSAQKQPPVNGGPDAVYEYRCNFGPVGVREKDSILVDRCPRCQWRGLTRPGSKG